MNKDEVKNRIREWIESNVDESIDSIREIQFKCSSGDFTTALQEILNEYENSVISSTRSITK